MAAVFSSKNAHADSVWPVSHHQPASDAAYNREGHMGQQGAFVKEGTVTFPRAAAKPGAAAGKVTVPFQFRSWRLA